MKIESKNWSLEIETEQNPQNPRSTDYTDCNVTKMVCFHKNYNLGDEHNYKKSDYESWNKLQKAIEKNEKVAAIKALYLYDHSGITIATTPFSCPWDSGQIGFIYVTKEKALSELTVGKKYVTEKVIDKAVEAINSEVKTFDQYINGEVYCFGTENKLNGDLDSCCGFYGSDIWTNGIADNVTAECIVDLYPQLKIEFGENKDIEAIIEKIVKIEKILNV